jgi:hypothetical protein
MAIDTQSLSQLITEFRSLTTKDSISPESLGSILQRIADLLATAGTDDDTTQIQKILDYITDIGNVVTDVMQGAPDRNNIALRLTKVSLLDSAQSASNSMVIQQATTERAGAMRAQQVTDLNAAKSNISTLQSRCTSLETALEELQTALDELQTTLNKNKVVKTVHQISCRVVDGRLRVYGAQVLTAAGYVPYLFRKSRKRNGYRHRVRTDKDIDRKYCSTTKGWHLYGSCYALRLSGEEVQFSTNEHKAWHEPANGYSCEPETLVCIHTNKSNEQTVAWGLSLIKLNDVNSKNGAHRMLRLRFGIGFGTKRTPASATITPASLISPLAEFMLIYEPKEQTWHFGN